MTKNELLEGGSSKSSYSVRDWDNPNLTKGEQTYLLKETGLFSKIPQINNNDCYLTHSSKQWRTKIEDFLKWEKSLIIYTVIVNT